MRGNVYLTIREGISWLRCIAVTPNSSLKGA
jgi:hypothetical protein